MSVDTVAVHPGPDSRRMLIARHCMMLLSLLPLAAVRAQGAPTAAPAPDTVGQRWEYDGLRGRYVAEVVAVGLSVPIGLSFLPDGRAIVGNRPAGRITLVDTRTGRLTAVTGGPVVDSLEDSGLLDISVHPDFGRNALIYYAFVEATDSGGVTVVERARLSGSRLEGRQRLFSAFPAMRSGFHHGARVIVHGGYLFVALGDRHSQDLAQEPWTHLGKVVRLHEDGRVPADNPFVGRAGVRPEIWTLGHRNPHGLAMRPGTDELWESEHGPLGGDEVNVIRRGANYGWPVVTHGREYNGEVIGEGRTTAEGMADPAYHWSGSAAASGLAFYTGDAFPEWRGNAFIGAMTPRYLSRLIIEEGRPIREERLLLARRWRIRSVQQGRDGHIYLGIQRTAATRDDGMLVRLRPAR